jgi:hypothetical protein
MCYTLDDLHREECSILTNFYIPVDTERAIIERCGITWFKDHRREKFEAIVNRLAFGCTNRQVVRSSLLFPCRAEWLRILHELSAVQTKKEVQASESSQFTGRTKGNMQTHTCHPWLQPKPRWLPLCLLTKIRQYSIYQGNSLESELETRCCGRTGISARKSDKQRLYSLETPEHPFLITLRCWKSADLKNVPDQE